MSSEDAEKESQSSDSIPATTYENFVGFTKKYAFWTFALIFLVFFFSYWAWLLICSGYFEWDPNLAYNAEFDVDASEDDTSNLYRYHEEARDPNYNSAEERANSSRVLDDILAGFDDLFRSIDNLTGNSSSEDNGNSTTMSTIVDNEMGGSNSTEML